MNTNDPQLIDSILPRLDNVKRNGNGYTARCPAHEDKENSLSLATGDDGRLLLKCFVGYEIKDIVEKLGLKMSDLFPKKAAKSDITVAELAGDKKLPEEFLKGLGVVDQIDLFDKQIVRITYRRQDGSMAERQRIRSALKANKGSTWSKGKGCMMPYGLWQLKMAVEAGYLVIVEGESDVWTLWYHKFPALGLPGASMAKLLQPQYLKDIPRAYIVQEPDKGGETFVEGVSRRLAELGWTGAALILSLHGIKDPNELHKRSPENFETAFKKAMEDAVPAPTPIDKKTNAPYLPIPWINADNNDLKAVTEETWGAFQGANKPPKWFRRGGVSVRIESDDDSRPILRDINLDRMRHILARIAVWYIKNKKGELVPALPPLHVAKDLLATPDIPLPIVNRMVESPVFAPDGTLETAPGYHAASRTYYAPAPGFTVPAVPDKPLPEDVSKAKGLIDDLISDFPFVSEAERAHAISFLMLPSARDIIAGPTPLHLFEAPCPGTGKTLLTDILTYPAHGRPVTTMSEGRDEDEYRKRITAKLMMAPSYVMLDNIRRRLDSAAFSAAITSPSWEDRVLGESKIVSLPVRCVWAATGNNPALSSEMARRTVRIRLDAKCDQPWLRKEFKHQDLRGWAKEHRGDLVWAILTLIKAWLSAGRPLFKGGRLGMFEAWSQVMGGILENAGIKGFLGNLEQFYTDSDAESSAWRMLVNAWWDKFQDAEVGVSELFELAVALDDAVDLGKGTEKSQKTRLGQELVKMRDRQFGDLRIILAGERQRAKRWKLIRLSEPVNLSEPNSTLPIHRENIPNTQEIGKGSPTFTGSPAQASQIQPPSSAESLFSPEELSLLKDSPQEDLAGLSNLKKAFPACVVSAVDPSPTEEPVSEAERKAQEMDAHLKDVCRRRNLAFADIEKFWPAVEKRRRQQKKEERNHGEGEI